MHSSIKQLDTVYTKLRLRVSRLGGETFPKSNCAHCWVLETCEHVFFDCPIHKDHRTILQNDLLKLDISVIDRRTLLFPDSKVADETRKAMFNYLVSTKLINKL